MAKSSAAKAAQPDESNANPLSRALSIAIQPHLDVLGCRKFGQHLTAEEDAAIIAILATQDDNVSRTATITGLSKGLIWDVRQRNMGAFPDARERFKRSHTLRMQDLTTALTDKVADAIESQPLSVRDGMVSIGIAIDKAAMLAGEGAQVNVNVRHSIDPAMIAADVARLRDIMGGRPTVMEAEFTVVDEE